MKYEYYNHGAEEYVRWTPKYVLPDVVVFRLQLLDREKREACVIDDHEEALSNYCVVWEQGQATHSDVLRVDRHDRNDDRCAKHQHTEGQLEGLIPLHV